MFCAADRLVDVLWPILLSCAVSCLMCFAFLLNSTKSEACASFATFLISLSVTVICKLEESGEGP